MAEAFIDQRVICQGCRYIFAVPVPLADSGVPAEDWRVEAPCPSCEAVACFTPENTPEREPPRPEPQSAPAVSVRRFRGRILVSAIMTPAWDTYVEVEPIFSCPAADVTRVGALILECLRHFRRGEDPEHDSAWVAPVLRAAGVESWQEFANEVQTCFVCESAGRYHVMLLNGGGGGVVEDARPASLGEGVVNILRRPDSGEGG